MSRAFGQGWSRWAMPLRRFNRLSAADAAERVRYCLAVDRWVQTVCARPYRGLGDLFEVAREAAFPFTAAELEAAVAGLDVPDVVPPTKPKEGPAETRLREQLAAGVQLYERRFGRPFLVRTDGRGDAQILVQLWERLGHDIDTEDRVLAQQVREIALAGLARLVTD